jgi:outer membrane protein
MLMLPKLALFIALASFSAYANAGPKVGYVDVERILKESPLALESAKKLKNEFVNRKAEIDRLGKRIEELESSETSKEKDISTLKVDHDRKLRELNEDLSIHKRRELDNLQDRINKTVKAVSESAGFDIVFYNSIAYANNRIDITDKVIQALSKASP